MKRCAVCEEKFAEESLFPLSMVKSSTYKLIKREHPNLTPHDLICEKDFSRFKSLRASEILKKFKTHLSKNERLVLKAINNQYVISADPEDLIDEKATFGDRMADRIALFGGSWAFVISFFAFLFIWIIVNSFLLFTHPFDPYPYILLNLALSCLAAIQAPIILMSQNRQDKKDRIRSHIEYRTNLKAELEIRVINSKLDHLMKKMWEKGIFDEK